MSGSGRQQLGGGIGQQRRRLGRQRRIERARREDQRQRLALEPARDERERPRRWRVAPLQVVDEQHQRRVGARIRREPVQAVLPRVAGIALAGPADAAAQTPAPAPRRARRPPAPRRPPASARARPASASTSARSNSWRTTPNGNPCSSSVARAVRTRRPSCSPRERASIEQPRLADARRRLRSPATPPARCPTARSAVRMRSSSCSRSSSASTAQRSCWSMRPARSYGSCGAPAQCSGVDVRGCARCGRALSGGRMRDAKQLVRTRRNACRSSR